MSSAAFSPDGKRIVTASEDKTARLWDAATGKPIGEPLKGHEDSVKSAAFSPDGTRIVTASADKTARLWEVFANTQEFVAHAKAASPRCLSPARRIEFFLPPEPPYWCIELETVALPYAGMEDVARRYPRRQESAVAVTVARAARPGIKTHPALVNRDAPPRHPAGAAGCGRTSHGRARDGGHTA